MVTRRDHDLTADDLDEAFDILYRAFQFLEKHDLNRKLRDEIAEFLGLDEHE